MTKTQQIKAALVQAQIAVTKLETIGLKVIDVHFGNRRPVIRIDSPPKGKKPAGSEVIRVRGINGITEHIFAAHFNGCLVTWAADILAA